MKKAFILLFCLIIQLTANAQFKVHSNGYVSVQNTGTTALSPVSLNGNGDSSYYMTYKGRLNGIRSFVNQSTDSLNDIYAGYFQIIPNTGKTGIGIKGYSSGSRCANYSGSPTAVGVFGSSTVLSNCEGFSYGVYGRVTGTNAGAAVCGRTILSGSIVPDQKYAGFFVGPTKMVGDLTVTGSIQGVLLGNSSPSSNLNSETMIVRSGSLAEKLSGINAVSYYQEESGHIEEKGKVRIDIEEDFPEESRENGNECGFSYVDNEEDIIEQQIHNKLHYALAVDELERAFPELVYETKDGTKAINYMEMIPLLVQSINELQAQINALTGKEDVKKTHAVTSVESTSFASQARLFQNTPNPFNERTEIRFSLPDDTQNANICVFDMSGKMLKQIPVTSSMQSITINGYELAAGMYLYSLVVGGQEIDTKKMIITK